MFAAPQKFAISTKMFSSMLDNIIMASWIIVEHSIIVENNFSDPKARQLSIIITTADGGKSIKILQKGARPKT